MSAARAAHGPRKGFNPLSRGAIHNLLFLAHAADYGRYERARPFPGKGRCHMSEQTPESAPGPLPLPDAPNIEWLRKQAKRRLAELRKIDRNAKLAAAQFDV